MAYNELICTAKELVQQARDSKGAASRQLYVEAAAALLNASRTAPSFTEKKQCITLANQLYETSQVAGNELTKDESTIKATIIRKPKTRFRDIAGLEAVKQEIRMKILAPFQYPEVFRRFGKKPGGGVLMWGPPGCGKSLLAEATAGEADATFFNVKASDLKSKYVGETERNIAALFNAARAEPAAIIFFDEFEAIGGDRSTATAHERNFVSQLLTEMDSVGNKDQKMLFIAATNMPWAVDVALRREGRFGTTVYIPPPDLESRQGILAMHLTGRPVEPAINLDYIAKHSEGFSGADIKAVVEKAADAALKDFLATGQLRPMTNADFQTALSAQRSNTQQWLATARKQSSLMEEEGFRQVLA
ncbi:ATP-binding protein [Candidatus Woesearchaeota archaeon]|nr:ATP-binding protein [Candidatus Woesearchaeota archaeon]